MQLDANHTTEQVSKQDLQAVTGGCAAGCGQLAQLALEKGTSMTSDLNKVHSYIKPLVDQNIVGLVKVANIAGQTQHIAPPAGEKYCVNTKYLNQAYNHFSPTPYHLPQ